MPKILIVDDSPILRSELRSVLEGGGHQVIEMESGQVALQSLKSIGFVDIVISDYNMPDLDGVSFCGKLRADPSFKNTPVLMLTTEASPALKISGKEAGVTLWFVKPFNKDKLLQGITMILSRAEKNAPT